MKVEGEKRGALQEGLTRRTQRQNVWVQRETKSLMWKDSGDVARAGTFNELTALAAYLESLSLSPPEPSKLCSGGNGLAQPQHYRN